MAILPYTTGVKITRHDATVEAYTSHDQDLTVAAQLYRTAASYTPTGVSRNTELAPDNIDLQGLVDGIYLTKEDLRAGDYDGAAVEIITINWETSTKVETLVKGFLGKWTLKNNRYFIELNSIESEYGKPLGEIVTLRCRYALGSAKQSDGTGCGFTLVAVTGSVTAQGTPPNRSFVDTSRTEADGFFDGGKVTFTSGANNNRSMDVKTWTNSTKTFELYEPMFDDIETLVTYDATQGCDKTFATCRDTFSNQLNFGGFPYLPGISDIIGKQTG